MDGMGGPGLQTDAREASLSTSVIARARPAAQAWQGGLAGVAWRICNALQFVYALVWTVGWILLALLVRPWSGPRARLPLRMAARCWAPGLLAGGPIRLQVEGRERIDFSRPCLFVANHQSIIDVCALFSAIPVPLRFLLKEEMRRAPFVGWYACATGMLFIVRDSVRAGALFRRQAAALLADGQSLCLFPEGTRSRSGELASFKAGSLQPAIDAGVDVVPVALHGTGRVLPIDGLFRARPGTIRVGFGAPLPTRVDGRPVARQELAERAQARVQAILDGWD